MAKMAPGCFWVGGNPQIPGSARSQDNLTEGSRGDPAGLSLGGNPAFCSSSQRAFPTPRCPCCHPTPHSGTSSPAPTSQRCPAEQFHVCFEPCQQRRCNTCREFCSEGGSSRQSSSCPSGVGSSVSSRTCRENSLCTSQQSLCSSATTSAAPGRAVGASDFPFAWAAAKEGMRSARRN
ncbi:uncharacterized protein LOC104916805 isoform X2 [Meleagris gallopavo]|uniref:uncharacterized protein LOC104916805 isoform X2 n=1 Tax=Meleagris gallopavo TaxID=9103 RepID=UPI0012ABB8CD|nr:uncharacterized protein LOC104916805 isoform X2 [Meleagris gallopavo]